MRLARFILLYLLFVDAMQLELKDIKGGVLEQDYSCALSDFPDLSELAEEGGPEFTEPLHFHLRFQRSGPIVELEGQLEAESTSLVVVACRDSGNHSMKLLC